MCCRERRRFTRSKWIQLIDGEGIISAWRVGGVRGTEPNDDRFLDDTFTFADNVLKHERDKYGPKKTPLLVNGINVEILEPVVWKLSRQQWYVSNLAS
ncbi:MAG TPA: hypothetical protein DIU00_16860 [Phycisphaerales bacterium]|nr:hypothetical protein [Phycisphaerales bacterium]